MMSYVDNDPSLSVVGAARVGAELRAARQRLGWQLSDMAQSLKIRMPYLQAIEDGRVADLPGNAYAVGFVRTYATFLGLDADEVSRRFRAEAQEVNRKPKLAFPAPVPERGIPAGAVILLGVLIAGGAYVGWYRYTGGEQGQAQVVGVIPERLAPLVPPPAPPTTTLSPQVASILPSQPVMPQSVSPMAPAASSPPALSPLGSSPAATSMVGPAPLPVPMPVPVQVAPPPVAASAVLPADTRILLRAKTDSWMQVREKQGQVLFNRVLRAGETWPVPAKPNLLLTTGNAGGTELLVDGVVTAALGSVGSIRRDVALEPDQLKAAKPAAAPKPPTPKPASTPPSASTPQPGAQ